MTAARETEPDCSPHGSGLQRQCIVPQAVIRQVDKTLPDCIWMLLIDSNGRW